MAGAQEAGAQTKIYYPSALDIHPCRHCDGCLQTGRCVIDDDMRGIYEDLKTADGLVVASPMFFMSLTAQLKAVIDRCQCLWVLRYRLHQPISRNRGLPRRGLFLATGGTQYSYLFQPSLTILKSWCSVLEIKLSGELLFRGIDEKGAIGQHPTALQEALAAGRNLATPVS